MPNRGASGKVEYEVSETGPPGRTPVLSRYVRETPDRPEQDVPEAEAKPEPTVVDVEAISNTIEPVSSPPEVEPVTAAAIPTPRAAAPATPPAPANTEAPTWAPAKAQPQPDTQAQTQPQQRAKPPASDTTHEAATGSTRSESRPARSEPSGSLVPVPAAEEPKGKKVPFWKRIAIPRSAPADPAPPPQRMPSLDPVLSRLNALEKRLDAQQVAQSERLDRFEENIMRLWELEEQLAITEVRERMALLEANQEEIADGLHAVSRNLSILAVVLSLAVAAGILSLGLIL